MDVKTIKFFDKYKGSVICAILSLFNKKSDLKEIKPKNILVLQFWGVGETILTLPALRALRKKFPKSKIDVLVTSRNIDVYYKNKDVNNVIELKLGIFPIWSFMIKNFRKYDLVVDMEEYLNISSIISFFVGKNRVGFKDRIRGRTYNKAVFYNDKQHTVDTFLDLVKLVDAEIKVEKLISLNYSKEDERFVERFIKENKINKPIVAIAPGAAESAKSRMWFGNRFAKFADAIIEKYNFQIVFVGNKKEKKLIDDIIEMMENSAVNSAGIFTLKQLFAFLKKCNIVISNDAGAMHIGAAQGVKTIGLFGPNTPVRWAPYGKDNVSIYKSVFCSPCIHTHLGIVPECKWPKHNKYHVHCMKNISVEDVLKGFEEIASRSL